MTQRTVAVNFSANVAPYVAGVGKATAATNTLGTSAARTNAAMAGKTGLAAGAKQALGAFMPLPPVLMGVGGVAYALKTVIGASMEFESAMAGVRKTVDATEEEFEQITQGIRSMSLVVPTAAEEIAGVAEAAGQLGIRTENLLSFTRTMIDLGESTNMSAQDAAMALARVANITQMSQENFDRLGSTVVDLGNNFATTEGEIVEMTLGIAGAGNIVGLTEAQMLAFATVLSSVGIEAQAGGTAISRTFLEMFTAVSSGNERLQVFAQTAGMTVEQFSTLFRDDAATAVEQFVLGLQAMNESGGDLTKVLEEVGLSDIRVRRALLNMAGAGDLLTEALDTASVAWEENTALAEEAARRYATTESAARMFGNTIKDVARGIGGVFTPSLNGFFRSASDGYLALTDRNALAMRATNDFASAVTHLRDMTAGLSGTQLQAVLDSKDYEAALDRVRDTAQSVRAVEYDLGMTVERRGFLTRDANEYDAEAIRLLELHARNAIANLDPMRGMNAAAERWTAQADAYLLALVESGEGLDAFGGTASLSAEQMQMLTDAIDDNRQAQLALVDPVYAAVRAERELREATDELADADRRLLALPGEIAAARRRLSAANNEAATASSTLEAAEARLAELEAEGRKGTEAYADAREWLSGAKAADREASRDLAEAQERLNALNAEAAEIDDRLVDAMFELTIAEIERNAALERSELVSDGFLDGLYEQIEAQGLSAEAVATLSERLNDLGIDVSQFDLDPMLRNLRDMIIENNDLQGAFEESGMASETFKQHVLRELYNAGELTLERFIELVREVNNFGSELDGIDGRVTQSEHVHVETTIKRTSTMDSWEAAYLGARARGGPVEANRAYLVGEDGPELMVPNVSGTILNAAQMAASGLTRGGGVTIENYNTYRDIDDDALLSKLEWAQERGRL